MCLLYSQDRCHRVLEQNATIICNGLRLNNMLAAPDILDFVNDQELLAARAPHLLCDGHCCSFLLVHTFYPHLYHR